MNTSEHLSTQYDADLRALRSRVMDMGMTVDEQFRLAIEALTQGREEIARRVIENDARVNELEVSIDDDCARVIAKRQPAAGDLRMVLGVTRMTTDLERIGDKARKIARLSAPIRSSSVADDEWLRDIKDLAARASTLVREALNAFVRGELDGAIDVIRQANALGRQSNAVSNVLTRRMSEQPGEIAVLLDMLSVVRAVDRVADHAGNLSEHLIYIVHGTDVRHATLDQIEREALQR